MGNSCVTGSGRSNQGQSQELNGAQTTFKWRIDGFSSLLDKGNGWTYSSVFQIRGLNWYLKLNPRDTKNGDKQEYVSLKLELAKQRAGSGTVVETSFKFLIYDQSYGKHHEEHQGNDVSETLFVQKINNICSDPLVYNWNIDDFFLLKSLSTSPEFEFCGYKWFITIRPSGSDKNGNHLSLFLSMKMSDTLHENSANLVEFSISIKDQETGKHRKLPGRCQFSKNSPSWGWDKFISLEDFKDPSNGYLVKTKCCIEAQVATIGSSKME